MNDVTWSDTQRPLIGFAGDDRAVIHAEGPTQSGKSYALAQAFSAYILKNEWPRMYGFDGFLVLGPKMVQVNAMLRNIQEATRRLGGRCDLRANGVAYVDGHRVLGKPISNAGSHDGFHGGRFGAVLVDEVTLCHQEVYEYAVGRVVVPPYGETHGKLFTATNPDSPHHWFHVRTGELGEPIIHSGIDDNPALTRRTKDELHKQWTGVMLQRMYYGRRAAHSGLVYPFFREQVIQREYPDEDPHAYILSLDGGNRNATHVILWACWVNHMRAIGEWRHSGATQGPCTTSAQMNDVEAWVGDTPLSAIYYDPAALDFGIELRERFPRVPVMQADNDVMPGIQQCLVFMDRGVLSLDAAACPVTVRECSAYSWDPSAAQRGLPDRPLKVQDDGADSFRYGVYSYARSRRTRSMGIR